MIGFIGLIIFLVDKVTHQIIGYCQRGLIPKVVFSNTLETAGWSNTRLVKGSAEEELARLKQEPGKDLFIFGSANLTSSFTNQGLIDEYRIGLNPLILGGGTPMFKPSEERMRLKLLEVRQMQSGVVLLRYARA